MQSNINLIIGDVKEAYVKYRKKGQGREEAIQSIREFYEQELQDDEDRVAVLIGMSQALCKKKELLESIATETLDEIQMFQLRFEKRNSEDKTFKKIEQCLYNKDNYGKEATYKQRSTYLPDWQIGDVFSHMLTYPTSEKLGIKGWYILLYKVGEYVDEFDEHRQLMYVSLCPPDKVPSCAEELEKLGFLKMMRMGDRSEYLAQITIKSKRAENAYGLTKIDCFPGVLPPKDSVPENPLTAMPLIGSMGKNALWPGYENQICKFYKWYGKNL